MAVGETVGLGVISSPSEPKIDLTIAQEIKPTATAISKVIPAIAKGFSQKEPSPSLGIIAGGSSFLLLEGAATEVGGKGCPTATVSA